MCYIFWVCGCSLRYPLSNVRAPIVISSLSGSTIFFHIISQTARFSKKRYWAWNERYDFLYNFSLKPFLFWEELSETLSQRYIGLQVKYPLLLSHFNETWTSRQIFEKYSNMKFYKNPSNGNRAVPCGWTDRHDEANSRFSQFCELAKKSCHKYTCNIILFTAAFISIYM
jgi:hypothetical protein